MSNPVLIESVVRVRAARFAEAVEIFHGWAPEAGSQTDLFAGAGPAVLATSDLPTILRAVGFDPVQIDPATGDLVGLGVPDFDAVPGAAYDCLSYVAEPGGSFLFGYSDLPADAELRRFRWRLLPGRHESSFSDVDTEAEAAAKAAEEAVCDCCPCCDSCDHGDD